MSAKVFDSNEFLTTKFSAFNRDELEQVVSIAGILQQRISAELSMQTVKSNYKVLYQQASVEELSAYVTKAAVEMEATGLMVAATKIFEKNEDLKKVVENEELNDEEKNDQIIALIQDTQDTIYKEPNDVENFTDDSEGDKNSFQELEGKNVLEDFKSFDSAEDEIEKSVDFLIDKIDLEDNQETFQQEWLGVEPKKIFIEEEQEGAEAEIEIEPEIPNQIEAIPETEVEKEIDIEEQVELAISDNSVDDGGQLAENIETNMAALLDVLEELKGNVKGI